MLYIFTEVLYNNHHRHREVRNIKNRLKLIRKEQNITQQELADRVNLARQTISAIENNRLIPTVYNAIRISKVLNVTCTEIFYE